MPQTPNAAPGTMGDMLSPRAKKNDTAKQGPRNEMAAAAYLLKDMVYEALTAGERGNPHPLKNAWHIASVVAPDMIKYELGLTERSPLTLLGRKRLPNLQVMEKVPVMQPDEMKRWPLLLSSEELAKLLMGFRK